MNFDLKAASLSRSHFRAVGETQICEPATERQHVLSKRPAQVGGVAPGVEAAKIAIHFALGVADTGVVADHQRSVYRDHSGAVAGLGLDPSQDVVRLLQTGYVSEGQTFGFNRDGRQAAWLSRTSPDRFPETPHCRSCSWLRNEFDRVANRYAGPEL